MKFVKTTRKAHSALKKVMKQLRKSFGMMHSAHETYQDLIDQALDLTKYAHASIIVSSAAILEYDLERCIKATLQNLNSSMNKRLFDSYGPLSTFAAKIDLAYTLGITTAVIHEEMNKVRRIRNEVSHSMNALTNPDDKPDSIFIDHVQMLDDFLERYLVRMGVTENIRDENLLR